MSITAISSSAPLPPQAEAQKTPAPVPAQTTAAPVDTVSISAAGHKSAGDADHDGDSH